MQKQKTRQKLLQIAMAVFADNGFVTTKTIDIAQKAGVSHGSVFTHFPTRENLIVTVIEEFGTQVMQRTHELATAGSGIEDVLTAHLDCLQEYEPFYARLISESASLPDTARHTLTGIQTAVSHHLFTAAQKEMAAGQIRTIKMHLLFNTWIGLLHHYLINRDLFAPGQSVIAAKRDELLAHFLQLIRNENK